MKKYIGIALVVIGIFSLIACGNHQKINLPEQGQITAIEMMVNTSESGIKMTNQDDIYNVLTQIKSNTINTGKESNNDQPTISGEYVIVKVHHKMVENHPSIFYVYKHQDICYVEQPYVGIWQLSEETFDSLSYDLPK